MTSRWLTAGCAVSPDCAPDDPCLPKTLAGMTRALIRRMSRENPLVGAQRIHGELLMLGIKIAESTASRYMIRRRRPPSQSWKTFLRNHAAGIASLDLFVVRTISFKLLFSLAILDHLGEVR